MPAFVSGAWRISVSESVTAVLNFFRITSGSSTIRTTPCGAPRVVDMSRSGSWRFLIARALLRIDAARDRERRAVTLVEAFRDVARQLEMLALVVADRDDLGLVEEDVAGHQHRIGEEPGRDEVLALGLLLELRHPPQLAEARRRAQQPGGLGVGDDVALREDRRAIRVEARREQHRRTRERVLAQLRGLDRSRDGVQVDDAEERFALLLRRDVLPIAARVVAERLVARRADPGEDARLRGSVAGCGSAMEGDSA